MDAWIFEKDTKDAGSLKSSEGGFFTAGSSFFSPVLLRPSIDITVSTLSDAGIKNITFFPSSASRRSLGHLRAYSGVNAAVKSFHTPFDGLKRRFKANKPPDGSFIALDGSVLSKVRYGALINKHNTSGADITLALTSINTGSGEPFVTADPWGYAVGLESVKKVWNYSFCGVAAIKGKRAADITDCCNKDDFYSLLSKLIKELKVSVYITEESCFDISSSEGLYRANMHYLDDRLPGLVRNMFENTYYGYRVGSEKDSLISLTSVAVGKIRHSVLGRGSIVASGASVENCVVLDGVTILESINDALVTKDAVYRIERAQSATDGENMPFSTSMRNIFS